MSFCVGKYRFAWVNNICQDDLLNTANKNKHDIYSNRNEKCLFLLCLLITENQKNFLHVGTTHVPCLV